jgi:hypothetical protein
MKRKSQQLKKLLNFPELLIDKQEQVCIFEGNQTTKFYRKEAHMKLQSLTARSLGRYQSVDIDLSRPVTYLGGPNNSGKSTLRHALQFVLTGKVRSCKHLKDSSSLRSSGSDLMTLSLAAEDGSGQLDLARSMPGRKMDTDQRYDDPLINACLDPMAFVELPQSQRGKILSDLVGRSVDKAEIAKAGIFNHTTVSKAFEVQLQTHAPSLDFSVIDAIEESVIDMRKALKRERLPLLDRSRPVLPEGAGELSVAELDPQVKDLQVKLESLRTKHKNYIERKNFLEQIQRYESEITDMKSQIAPAAGDKLTKVKGEFATATALQETYDQKFSATQQKDLAKSEILDLESKIQKVDVSIDGLSKEIDEIKANISILEQAAGAKDCPVCGSKLLKNMVKEKIDLLNKKLLARTKSFNEWDPIVQDNLAIDISVKDFKEQVEKFDQIIMDRKDAMDQTIKLSKLNVRKTNLQEQVTVNTRMTDRIKQAQRMIDDFTLKMPEVKTTSGDVKELIAELEAKVGKANKIIERRKLYEDQINTYNIGRNRLADLDVSIMECDRVAALVSSGGDVRAKIVQAGVNVPYNEDLAAAWGLKDFKMLDNGAFNCSTEILMKDGVLVASTSQRFRIAALVGMALAELSGYNFVVLDGIDILDKQNINSLFACVQSSTLNNIILTGTTSGDLSSFTKYDWLSVYKIEAVGQQSELNEISSSR